MENVRDVLRMKRAGENGGLFGTRNVDAYAIIAGWKPRRNSLFLFAFRRSYIYLYKRSRQKLIIRQHVNFAY